jgi:hypothetical protein
MLVLNVSTVADKAIVDNKSKVTDQQLKTFLDICWKKYVKAKIEPGRSFYGDTCLSC